MPCLERNYVDHVIIPQFLLFRTAIRHNIRPVQQFIFSELRNRSRKSAHFLLTVAVKHVLSMFQEELYKCTYP